MMGVLGCLSSPQFSARDSGGPHNPPRLVMGTRDVDMISPPV